MMGARLLQALEVTRHQRNPAFSKKAGFFLLALVPTLVGCITSKSPCLKLFYVFRHLSLRIVCYIFRFTALTLFFGGAKIALFLVVHSPPNSHSISLLRSNGCPQKMARRLRFLLRTSGTCFRWNTGGCREEQVLFCVAASAPNK